MSYDEQDKVWAIPSEAMSPTQRLLLLAVAYRQNRAQVECHISIRQIMKDTGLKRRCVESNLAKLKGLGLLVSRNATGGSCHYRIIAPTPTPAPNAEGAPAPNAEGAAPNAEGAAFGAGASLQETEQQEREVAREWLLRLRAGSLDDDGVPRLVLGSGRSKHEPPTTKEVELMRKAIKRNPCSVDEIDLAARRLACAASFGYMDCVTTAFLCQVPAGLTRKDNFHQLLVDVRTPARREVETPSKRRAKAAKEYRASSAAKRAAKRPAVPVALALPEGRIEHPKQLGFSLTEEEPF